MMRRRRRKDLDGGARFDTRRGRVFAFLTLVPIALLVVIPFAYVFNASLSQPQDLIQHPWSPVRDATLEAYRTVAGQLALPRPLFNSLVTSAAAILLLWAVGGLAAYACVFTDMFGKNLVLVVIVASLMIPLQTILFPLFKTMLDLNLVNTYQGLILSYVGFGLPLTTFLFAAYFKRLPKAVIEAARVDGASTPRIFFNVILPMSMPVVAVTGIVNFIWTWSEFFLPLILLQDPSKQTLVQRLALIPNQLQANDNETAAAAVIGVLPVLVVYLVAQRQIIAGITSGATKG